MKYFIIIISILLTGCTPQKEHAGKDQYTCPMHPTVVQDKPGTCPVCGMQLVKKRQPSQEVKITSELSYLLKPTNANVITSIATFVPIRKSMEIASTVTGAITYDTRRITAIPIRFEGRIEKLSLKYNFQYIKKGQAILEIYSPELAAAQRDLLYLLKSDSENQTLINVAKEKLRLLGVTNAQIDGIISSRKEIYSLSVYSPVDGYVVEEGIAIEGLSEKSSTELQTKEGMYVSAGQSIFKIINTDVVWAEFDMNQDEGSSLKIGNPIQIVLESREGIQSKIDFIQPFFTNGGSFKKVRVYLENKNKRYVIGQWLTASFTQTSEEALWIPLSARLDLGTRELAFVKWRGLFKPRPIVTGRRSGEWIEVLKGVNARDSLTINAQFLIDSESFIKVKN